MTKTNGITHVNSSDIDTVNHNDMETQNIICIDVKV